MKTGLFITGVITLISACSTVVGPDNVALPPGYKNHVYYATVDRVDNKQVRDIYASPETAKMARAGRPLPYGSVLTMEIYSAKTNAKGDLAKDAAGRLVKGDLSTIFVMEKRAGWGAGYADELRNGDGNMPASRRTASAFRTSTLKLACSATSQDRSRISFFRCQG